MHKTTTKTKIFFYFTKDLKAKTIRHYDEKQQKVDIRTSKKQVFLVHLKKIVYNSIFSDPYIHWDLSKKQKKHEIGVFFSQNNYWEQKKVTKWFKKSTKWWIFDDNTKWINCIKERQKMINCWEQKKVRKSKTKKIENTKNKFNF